MEAQGQNGQALKGNNCGTRLPIRSRGDGLMDRSLSTKGRALLTSKCPQSVNSAFCFGVEEGPKLRAIDGPKRSQTDKVAASHTPMNLPTRGHVAPAIRTCRKAALGGGLAASDAGRHTGPGAQ